MKKLIALCLVAIVFGCKDSNKSESNSETIIEKSSQVTVTDEDIFQLHFDLADKQEAEQINTWLKQGQKTIDTFFNKDFEHPFDVYVFSSRDSLDAQWQKDWNMPGFKSQCWMVASGIAHRLDILSPGVWNTQACEHDSSDKKATKNLVIHELTHVFHGQHNPSPTFENIDNIDWLVEGIAVYVSGQLDDARYQRAKTSIQQEDSPNKLAEIWRGENRYGFAGSMVKFIDEQYGRDVLFKLMSLTKAEEVLQVLDISEDELINQWKHAFE
jgi:hypothetical protein